MSVILPRPVALPEPPGSPVALGAVVDQLTSAGLAAGLTVHLLEPAAVLSGWQGADATVAAAEVGAAIAVAADLQDALSAVRARLLDHHELWLAVLGRVAELRDDQRAQFATAASRLAVLVGTAVEAGGPVAPPPQALALVQAVAEEDAGRAAEHRGLLQALAEDARGAGAVLAAAALPFGGTGRAGDAVAVTVRLAVQLPGWGAGALEELGAQAGDDLSHPGTVAELAAAVARWRPYAALPGFADALVGRLGADGLTWLLSVLAGVAGTGEAEPLAALLAGALSGSGAHPGERVGEVLSAVRLDPDDPDRAVDGLAVAMGLVLAAPGAGPMLAAVWGRQLLAREAAQGRPAGAGVTGGAVLPDPVDAALVALARAGDPVAAALLLEDPGAWTTLLSRPWPGGTESLAAVVGLAAAAPQAGRAARSALLALGRGLAPGSTDRVVDDQVALARVRAAVTGLVAGQPGVVLPVLDAAATGVVLDTEAETALRGLGYLAADPGSAAEVTAEVRAALRAGEAGAFTGQVAGAHVALLEYGQRLRYALAWSHDQSRAVDAEMPWTFAVSLPVALVPGNAGALAGVGEGALAEVLDANGDVEIGPDTGEVRTADDAARFAVQTLGPTSVPGAGPISAAAARIGFDRTGEVLGRLVAPGESLLDRLGDLSLPDPGDRPRRGPRGGR
ncbi:MAG TPA: hypothetical protein VGO95_07790 [Modestobacter sp.]|nr:hypothetical protein [Modestobacter sp.]